MSSNRRRASGYDRDPRSLARRAEAYLKSTGIGDTAYFGPEPEFFIFDSVTWNVDMSGCHVRIKSEEAPWSTGIEYEAGDLAHRPPVPTLTLYGSVAKLTQGQEGSLCEGVSGMPHVEATGPCN